MVSCFVLDSANCKVVEEFCFRPMILCSTARLCSRWSKDHWQGSDQY